MDKNNYLDDVSGKELTRRYYKRWQRMTSAVMAMILSLQVFIPAAASVLPAWKIEQLLNSTPQFSVSTDSSYQTQKAGYAPAVAEEFFSIEKFQQQLIENLPHLVTTQYVPIGTGDITTIIPLYPMEKRIGDKYVQTRMVRLQVQELLGRTLINSGLTDWNTELKQISQLYQAAFRFATSTNIPFGTPLSEELAGTTEDMIWPEVREVNGESVLVPTVYLSSATMENREVKDHETHFDGSNVQFGSLTINGTTVSTGKNTYIQIAENLINNRGTLTADQDLTLAVSGTLRNLGGSITAGDDLNILAGRIENRSIVHRATHPRGYGDRLVEVADISAGGDLTLRSYSDIIFEGATAHGENITLEAKNGIYLLTQELAYTSNGPVGGWKTHDYSSVEHIRSSLSAEDSIYLIGQTIQLNAAQLHADKGVINILAENGIYITNEFNSTQEQRKGKFGRTTKEMSEFQTIAIRSALDAGKGIIIASEFGDITLKATEISSAEGTEINASNGKVHLLMAKEQDHYFSHKVTKGFWKIKTETIEDKVDTAVYNQIIGGVKVHATHGLTLELGQKEGETLEDTLAAFSQEESLAWMEELYHDPELSQNTEIVYQKLLEIHKHERTSSLSPAAMAVIAIAVAVAMGPGAGFITSGGTAGSISTLAGNAVLGAALEAGAVTLATQAATALASGKGLDGALEQITSSDGLKSLATSMVTAGVLNSAAIKDLKFFENATPGSSLFASQEAIDIARQATQVVVRTTVSTAISTVISGGDFSDFTDQFVQSLKLSAVNAIGKNMAEEIGVAVDENRINESVRYIAHAALGCALGAATAEVEDSESSSGVACASGAGGAVIGEVIADQYKDQNDYDGKVKQVEDALAEAGLDIDSVQGLTDAELKDLLRNKDTVARIAEIQNLKATGVDLARLGAGLAAFAAGGEVNIAAGSAENAAENNAFWFVLQAGYLLYKAYELYATLEGVAEFVDKMKVADEDEKIELIKEFALQLGIDIVVGKTADKAFGVFLEQIKKTSIGSDVIDELEHISHKLESGNLSSYKLGDGQGSKAEIPDKTNQIGLGEAADKTKDNDAIPTAGGHVNKCKVADSYCALSLDDDLQKRVDDYVDNIDSLTSKEKGELTEGIVNDLAKKDPNVEVINATYNGGVNGIDQLVLIKGENGETKLTLVIDSKQIGIGGTVKLAKGAGGHRQLTDAWIDAVLAKPDMNPDAINAIMDARANGTLRKAVTGINRSEKQLWFIPISYD